MRQILFFMMSLACAYMCVSIVFWPELTKNSADYSNWILMAYHAYPWLLVWLSLKGWYQSFVWRRMVEARNPPPTLSRGEHRFDTKEKRTSILEWLCLLALLLSLSALWEIWL